MGTYCGGPFGSVFGEDEARESQLMVVQGLTPMEGIEAAIRVGAERVGIEGKTDSLEVGKLADLILVDGNPLRA